MGNINNFTKELTELCKKYGYSLSGKTTNGSIVVTKDEIDGCEILSQSEFNAHIGCN